MKLFKVSCHSKCGSYFASYLQSVTVAADSKESAIAAVTDWMADEGRSFIEKDDSKWHVTLLAAVLENRVVDWHEDADY